MSAIVMLVLFSLIVPVLVSAAMLDRHSLAWQPKYKREVTTLHAGEGAFRSATVEQSRWTVVGNGLPVPVFIAAFMSLVLGQMFVPGLLSAMFGLLFVFSREYHGSGFYMPALVIAAVPGAIAAISQFRVGLSLLRGRRAEAEQRSRRSLQLVLAHNVVLLGAGLFAWFGRDGEASSVPWITAAAVPFVLTAVLARAVFRSHESLYTADDPEALFALPEGAAKPVVTYAEQRAKVAAE